MYPACVNGVQSDILNGTESIRASVFAINVFPTPEDPNKRMFDFSSIKEDESAMEGSPNRDMSS
jgi:hypothetical protein